MDFTQILLTIFYLILTGAEFTTCQIQQCYSRVGHCLDKFVFCKYHLIPACPFAVRYFWQHFASGGEIYHSLKYSSQSSIKDQKIPNEILKNDVISCLAVDSKYFPLTLVPPSKKTYGLFLLIRHCFMVIVFGS